MKTNLWATPVWEFNTLVDCKKLLSELNDIPQTDGSYFNIWDHVSMGQELSKLGDEFILLGEGATNQELRIGRGWISTQDKGQSLPPHNHSGVPLVAVCYLQVPPNSGDLWLLDPRGAGSTVESHGHIDCVVGHKIEVMTGKIVMFPGYVTHYTEANMSDYRRISLAINFENT